MVKVLIVDDSAVIRQVFTAELSKDPDIQVIGTAPDPYVARDMIVQRKPDVITLDIEMPRMDGITFLRKLMHYFPLPVIVVSSLTPKGGQLAMEALSAGAVDVICKPGAAFRAGQMHKELIRAVKLARHVRMQRPKTKQEAEADSKRLAPLARTTNQVLAIGASTGGTTAVEAILHTLPVDLPGTIIAQHMPGTFTASFAARLRDETGLDIREARSGDSVARGQVLIAPGGRHLLLKRSGARYYVDVQEGPRVNGHIPSVDVMFRSVARTAGRNAVGVILTGMGRDGAKGLCEMHDAGARTIAQDEASCVVFGMPKAAIELGAADVVRHLDAIPSAIVEMLAGPARKAATG
jgi:two-component system chemotaxis response regulator CheB